MSILVTDDHPLFRDALIRTLGQGPQQYRVLLMLAKCQLNKQIAYELHVSEATIKAHMTAIFRKLGVQNRTQAVLALATLGVDSVKLG